MTSDSLYFVPPLPPPARSFVEDRRGKQVLATYCKNPRGCAGIVLMADDADNSEACCSLCATTFCAACDMPPHAPATCEMVRKMFTTSLL
jgi:hypothetical protein